MDGVHLYRAMSASWDRWRSSLAALAREASAAEFAGCGLGVAWAELRELMDAAQGHSQAIWDVAARWGVLLVGEAFLPTSPRRAAPHTCPPASCAH